MLRTSVPARQVSRLRSLPAPTGGINARDSLALMQQNQAIELVNLFPLQYGVRVRKGWRRFVTGITGNVETLMVYASLTGAQRMFAAANLHFYDVSSEGAVGGSTSPGGFIITQGFLSPADIPTSGYGSSIGGSAVAGPFANNRWQWTALTNTFGSFLVAVNGQDTPQVYNGATWAASALTADLGTYPTFDSKNFINVAVAHRRLWFVEKNTGNAWYLPVDQISGQVEQFDVGELFPNGGYLQAIGTWSVDGGSGINEYTVFVSSQGDVALYQGYDPTDATNFTLVAVYHVGPTLGRRCLCKRGGDLLILCETGLVPMTAVLAQGRAEITPLSDIIQQKITADIETYSSNFGWQVVIAPRHRMLLLNVPSATPAQYAMNNVTTAWCQFDGYDSLCWAVYNGDPYFGSGGFVGQAWYAAQDDYDADAQTGTDISARVTQAFDYFGATAQQKRWTMLRPTFNAVRSPPVNAALATDFDLSLVLTAPTLGGSGAVQTTWDSGQWDVALWGGSLQSIKNWLSAGAIGYAAALMLRLSTSVETTWVATDFVYEAGGTL
jgi:hypothetical protein